MVEILILSGNVQIVETQFKSYLLQRNALAVNKVVNLMMLLVIHLSVVVPETLIIAYNILDEIWQRPV